MSALETKYKHIYSLSRQFCACDLHIVRFREAELILYSNLSQYFILPTTKDFSHFVDLSRCSLTCNNNARLKAGLRGTTIIFKGKLIDKVNINIEWDITINIFPPRDNVFEMAIGWDGY